MFQCLKEGGSAQIEIKKSRFIATLAPVTSEEEAAAFIAETKKKYWNAKHNCSAFVIGEGAAITRCNDDGEPAGSAGRPMLQVLLGTNVCNVCAVVTRYFGGTLLGVGGLIRAYQDAVKEGLKECVIVQRAAGKRFLVETDYARSGKLQTLFAQENVIVEKSDYGERVTFTIILLTEQEEDITSRITDVTDGSAVFTDAGETVVELPVKRE